MSADSSGIPAAQEKGTPIRQVITESIRYWELRRIAYNAVLGLIVVDYFLAGYPASRAVVSLNSVLVLFFLAVLANVCYCAAYAVDVFAQMSGLRETWMRWRWGLLVIGTAFAAVITRFIALGAFAPFLPGS